MKTVAVIGLGDMGIGLADNLLKAGFQVRGFDLRQERLDMLSAKGGAPVMSCREAGEGADAVFVMVLNAAQVMSVVTGTDGLLESMQPGSTIIVSATIGPAEIREIEPHIADSGIQMIDTPVTGGKQGADEGTLTLIAAAGPETLESNRDVLEAISSRIFHVGDEIGMGQTTKASLQAIMGSVFAATFEALVLGHKAGIKGQVLYDVFTNSGIGCPAMANSARLVLDRKFENTGSHIATMYKDLGITMSLAHQVGAAMFTTSAVHELFQTGISLFPEGDNWSVAKFLEQIAGTEVRW
jgi:3-hydroxyisobutyrate dehydrogenase-like beta-hydroxyacid dehydrogenase